MNTNKAQEARPRMKWEQIILVVALLLFLVGLGTVSIVSFFQTETAFKGLNDPNIKGIGGFISIAFAFIFQYGQNAALYIRKKFCNDKTLFTLYTWDISDKTIALWVFWIFAMVDALTNIIWFYQTVEKNPDPFLNVVVNVLGYAAMILAVGVEEILGKALDAFSRATGELKTLLEWEKKSRLREKKTNDFSTRDWDEGNRNTFRPASKPISNLTFDKRQPSVIRRPHSGGGAFDGDELGTSMDSFLNSKPFIAKPRR